jgi:hypothetical protein
MHRRRINAGGAVGETDVAAARLLGGCDQARDLGKQYGASIWVRRAAAIGMGCGGR